MLTAWHTQNAVPGIDDEYPVQTLQRIGQRLEILEGAVRELRQYNHFLEGQRIRSARQFAAMQSLSESLIRTHQRPDLLLRWWHQEVPKLIEQVSEAPSDLPAEHQEEALAWRAMVQRYTYPIEGAAAYYEKRHDDDD